MQIPTKNNNNPNVNKHELFHVLHGTLDSFYAPTPFYMASRHLKSLDVYFFTIYHDVLIIIMFKNRCRVTTVSIGLLFLGTSHRNQAPK